MKVATYNTLALRHQVSTFGRNDNLGVVIGTTKLFWTGFVRFVCENPHVSDAVDEYSKFVIKGATSLLVSYLSEIMESFSQQFPNVQFEIRMSSDLPLSGKYIHIQTASHVSGL